MKEITIDSIGVIPVANQQVVILKEETTKRYLPIAIGPAEADAIAIKLQGLEVPRPLTHDLLHSVIEALGATVDSVIVTDLQSNTFYAKIILNVSSGQVELDSRPSDALALAVRAGVTIFAAEPVLNEAGVLLEKESGTAVPQETSEGKSVSEDELKRMSAFIDFVDALDMDDLGEERQEDE